MAKVKKVYLCGECGATSPKWIGKCPSCNQWNTYQEEVISKPTEKEQRSAIWKPEGKKADSRPVLLNDVEMGKVTRLQLLDQEFNRVLGGGLVPGSLILLGGQPGIGKSTLLLQIALKVSSPILYVSGEESEEQIKMRASRISNSPNQCFVINETDISKILVHTRSMEPAMLIIDSIQTLSSSYLDSTPGSISQIKECTAELQRFAKITNIPVVIIGHINKEGAIAGPKLLEHIVDTVIQFEGDRHYSYRILRTIKNRFGSTDEMGIYEMQANGLREVQNPSELLLSQNEESLSGSAVGATLEGLRPILIETQALVSRAVYGTPQRSATGFDLRRLSMLLAVLEKRCGFPFAQNDVFLNLAGGIKVDDPALDLAVISALISSLEDINIPPQICFAGEVGLSGEIRAVNKVENRIQEAERLGFEKIFISKYNTKGLDFSRYQISVNVLGKVDELYNQLFV